LADFLADSLADFLSVTPLSRTGYLGPTSRAAGPGNSPENRGVWPLARRLY